MVVLTEALSRIRLPSLKAAMRSLGINIRKLVEKRCEVTSVGITTYVQIFIHALFVHSATNSPVNY